MSKEHAGYAVFQMYVEHCPDDDALISITVGDLKELVAEAETIAEQRGRAVAVEQLRAMRDRLYGRCEHMDALENENARFNWSQVEILNEMIEVLELPPPRPVE